MTKKVQSNFLRIKIDNFVVLFIKGPFFFRPVIFFGGHWRGKNAWERRIGPQEKSFLGVFLETTRTSFFVFFFYVSQKKKTKNFPPHFLFQKFSISEETQKIPERKGGIPHRIPGFRKNQDKSPYPKPEKGMKEVQTHIQSCMEMFTRALGRIYSFEGEKWGGNGTPYQRVVQNQNSSIVFHPEDPITNNNNK